MTKLSEEQAKLIRKIAENEGFTNFEISTNVGSIKGDGYMGNIITVTISDDNQNKKLNLILKAAQNGSELRKNAPIRKAYEREIFLYDKVFKQFEELQDEKCVLEKFTSTAKYYNSSLLENNECLILENLKELNFKLWDRKQPMNSDHVALVFAEYGKFHALSLALKKLHPKKWTELTQNLGNVFDGSVSDEALAESTYANFQRAFKAVEGYREATSALRRFFGTAGAFFKGTVPNRDKYSVITHGDCWCNNMMFKYQGGNSPSKMCFLDWQLSTCGSPVLDLSYFFYACSSKTVIDDLNSNLKIYHTSLSKMLLQLGCNPDELFPFKELQSQWKIYSKYGMFMSILIIKIMLSDSSDAPDLQESAVGGKNILQALDIDSKYMKEYNQRLRDVILFMTRNNFL